MVAPLGGDWMGEDEREKRREEGVSVFQRTLVDDSRWFSSAFSFVVVSVCFVFLVGRGLSRDHIAVSCRSFTSSMTTQICFTHWMMASGVPEIVTARSVELGSMSPATWTWAPVDCGRQSGEEDDAGESTGQLVFPRVPCSSVLECKLRV